MASISKYYFLALMAKFLVFIICTKLNQTWNDIDQVQQQVDLDYVIKDHVTLRGNEKVKTDWIENPSYSRQFLQKYTWGNRVSRADKGAKCFDACKNESESDICEPEIDNWLVASENDWDYDEIGYRILFGTFYILLLAYLFVGVSIVSDRFMESIEVVTSQEKNVRFKGPDGEVVIARTHVWNETVANLTLMALGSSAPEICLAIIEVCVDDFQAGALGPGTIIGSAAYNFFLIIGLCIVIVPSTRVKRIQKFRVFIFTCIFSLFAYIWLFFILKATSPCEIEVWEASLTFLFFPVFVIIAWRIDVREQKMIAAHAITIEGAGPKDSSEESRTQVETFDDNYSVSYLRSERPITDEGSGSNRSALTAPTRRMDVLGERSPSRSTWQSTQQGPPKFRFTNTKRQQFLMEFQAAKKDNPYATDDQLLDQVATRMLNSNRKSRAYYRLMTLGADKQLYIPNNLRRTQRRAWNFNRTRFPASLTGDESRTMTTGLARSDPYPNHFKVRFDPVEYVVLENVGTMQVFVVRLKDKQKDVADFYTSVDFKTQEATAKAGTDFVSARGTLVFEPGDFIKTIEIKIIDDEIFEDDEFFSVHLSNMVNSNRPLSSSSRVKTPDTNKQSTDAGLDDYPCTFGDSDARVIIIDDDHRGIFSFEKDNVVVDEKEGEAVLVVKRFKGARAKVDVPYSTDEFTAKSGVDYVHTEGVLHFDDDDTEAVIMVPIINQSEYEKNTIFNVSLSNPKTLTSEADRVGNKLLSQHEMIIDLKGEARLGNRVSCMVTIVENQQFKDGVDYFSDKLTFAEVIKEQTWAGQFKNAVMVVGNVDEQTGEVKKPTKCNYCLHAFTVFWKLIFATLPPPKYCYGWWCFIGSLAGIFAMTYVVKIIATKVGCATGMKDYVTAVTCVAIGTSLPDTFASVVAAKHDEYADNAIGNVTGSNAVNVFLGIGIAWLIGAIVNAVRGCAFTVAPGDIGFSTVLYLGLAIGGIGVLLYRRFSPRIGGELGGPMRAKVGSFLLMVSLWVIYLVVATLAAYKVFIPGF